MNDLMKYTEFVPEPLTTKEAQECDARIVKSAGNLRRALLQMYKGEGWTQLGFDSWGSYLYSVTERSGMTDKQLRKITWAGLLESGSGIPVGTFKEGTVRPIHDILSDPKGFDQIDRTLALENAMDMAGEDPVTGNLCRLAALGIYVDRRVPEAGVALAARMRKGEVSPDDAMLILGVMQEAPSKAIPLLAEVSDPELATTLANLADSGGETWDDVYNIVASTGHLPVAFGKDVEIGKATNTSFLEYLNEPTRLRRQEEAVGSDQLRREVCLAAKRMMLETWPHKPNSKSDPLDYELWVALEKAGYIK